MAQNGISIAQARGNFLTWCISGFMPLAGLCKPLYIAPQLTDAEGEPGEFYVFYSADDAGQMFGFGSVAHLMAIQHFCTCPELPVYISPLDDPVGGVAATHTITITGPATNTGVLSVSIL